MDKLTPEQRKRCMQANKSKGTKPEVLLAKTMWRMGLRYRKNNKTVFGKPDFTFKKYKIAIFVDGEFWHGKDWEKHKTDFKSNHRFWISKIKRNIERDIEVTNHLQADGWQVFRFWSKDVIRSTDDCIDRIRRAIRERQT